MIFSSALVSEIYREHLINFLRVSVIPMYEDFLKNQLRCVRLTPDEQTAITMYCKTIMKKNVVVSEEFDMNEVHEVFDHMRKNI